MLAIVVQNVCSPLWSANVILTVTAAVTIVRPHVHPIIAAVAIQRVAALKLTVSNVLNRFKVPVKTAAVTIVRPHVHPIIAAVAIQRAAALKLTVSNVLNRFKVPVKTAAVRAQVTRIAIHVKCVIAVKAVNWNRAR
jgi:hypothetical protein